MVSRIFADMVKGTGHFTEQAAGTGPRVFHYNHCSAPFSKILLLPSTRPRESLHSITILLIRLLSAFLSQEVMGSNPQELHDLIWMPKGQAAAFGGPCLECLCALEPFQPEAGMPLSLKKRDKRCILSPVPLALLGMPGKRFDAPSSILYSFSETIKNLWLALLTFSLRG
jgi:hypothetical protein